MPEDKISIFYLEDNALVKNAMTRSLKRISTEVIAPTSPEELTQVLEGVNEQVKLAILDVNLDTDAWADQATLSAEYIPAIRRSFPNATLVLFTGANHEDLSHPEYVGLPLFEKPVIDIRAFRTELLRLASEA